MSGPFHSFFSHAGYPTYQARGGPFPEASSSSDNINPGQSSLLDGNFDIFTWHPLYLRCQKYFLDHAQYETGVQAVAALMNIMLPFQWSVNPIVNSNANTAQNTGQQGYNLPYPRTGQTNTRGQPPQAWVSLIPYIRRLIITGMDREAIMHGFFGETWKEGVGPFHECERRNYLFAAKSGGWAQVKSQYDMSPAEAVPFLKPIQMVQLQEIEVAERTWSQWLAMEDWMVGPRAPDAADHGQDSAGGFRES